MYFVNSMKFFKRLKNQHQLDVESISINESWQISCTKTCPRYKIFLQNITICLTFVWGSICIQVCVHIYIIKRFAFQAGDRSQVLIAGRISKVIKLIYSWKYSCLNILLWSPVLITKCQNQHIGTKRKIKLDNQHSLKYILLSCTGIITFMRCRKSGNKLYQIKFQSGWNKCHSVEISSQPNTS